MVKLETYLNLFDIRIKVVKPRLKGGIGTLNVNMTFVDRCA